MLVKFFRWISGYVEFVFTDGFSDKFLNACFLNGINLHNVKSEKNGIRAIVSFKEYKFLHRLAFSSGGKVHITKKRGVKLFLYPFKNRAGILVGFVLAVMLLSYLSGFIWDVNIIGNGSIDKDNISAFLDSNNLKSGVRWGSIDTDEIETSLMLEYPNLAWVHINKNGSVAQVEMNEAIKAPKIEQNKNIANIKAKKDGVIIKTSVKKGWLAKKAGEAVTKGDLLISGIFEPEDELGTNKDKKTYFAHAKGTIVAEVEDKVSVVVNREQSRKNYNLYREVKEIEFFGVHIPLGFYKKNEINTEYSSSSSYAKLNGKRLPIGINITDIRKYDTSTYILSDSALQKLAKKEIEKKIEQEYKNAEIISKEYSVKMDENSCKITAKIKSFQDIGEEIEVQVEKKEK